MKKFSQPLEMFGEKMWKLGKDDPRRVIHAIKVGLSLSVVSLFYLMEPLFDGVGDNAIWAIMTVVVVFEFTAGATLSKGLNRGIGTVVGGYLAVCVGYIAGKAGKIGEPVVIGSSCFILGTAATFFRFFSNIKIKYDYGVLIFILTFNMLTLSGYRLENICSLAYQRISTIAIGCVVSLAISLCICPIWAGDDLHRSIIKRIHGLADTLEGCMVECCKGAWTDESDSEKIVDGYKDVLDSKASEETLANFASWETRHGKFGYTHPWKQYVKVGGMLRHMAYCVVALHGCLHSEYQAPHINVLAFKKPYTYKVGMEVAKVLHELAESIKCMRQCPPTQSMMHKLHVAAEELNTSFCFQPKIWNVVQRSYKPDQCNSSNPLEANNLHLNPTQQSSQTAGGPLEHKDNECGKHDCNLESFSMGVLSLEIPSICKVIHGVGFSEAVPLAAFASLVIEIVGRLEHVIESVQELGRLAGFNP